jgi:hypothetical protein
MRELMPEARPLWRSRPRGFGSVARGDASEASVELIPRDRAREQLRLELLPFASLLR